MENTLTEEQAQQINEVIENLIESLEPIFEALRKICEEIKDFLVETWLNLKEFIEKNEKVKKYFKIYNKTHNQRIKKKQITKIIKLFIKIEQSTKFDTIISKNIV